MGTTKEFGILNIQQKMLLGTLGALTPTLIDLYATNLGAIPPEAITLPYILGHLMRILILTLYGTLIAYFHRGEENPVKIFQLGIAVPALVIILLGIGKNSTHDHHLNVKVIEQAKTSWFITPVYAQTPIPPIRQFNVDEPNIFLQFWRGFVGSKVEERNYAVLVNISEKWETVLEAYQTLKEDYPNFPLDVYESPKNEREYVLSVGCNLSKLEALLLAKQAEMEGMEEVRIIRIEPSEMPL